MVVSESGKSYDPQVAAILKQRYRELDSLARSQPANGKARLATNLRTTLGKSPAAGFEKTSVPAPQMEVADRRLGALSCIAAVRQEVQMLLELSHELGGAECQTDRQRRSLAGAVASVQFQGAGHNAVSAGGSPAGA